MTDNIKKLVCIFIVVLLFLFASESSGGQTANKENITAALLQPNPVLLPGPEGKELVRAGTGNVEEGMAVYKKYCVYCHGREGRGDGMAAIALSPSPADFSKLSAAWQGAGQDQRLFDIITYGSKGSRQLDMPAWGPVISRQGRLNVLAYIKTMFNKTPEKGAGNNNMTKTP